MNANLLFDFTVDKTTNQIHVKREFNAELPLVWKAWTTPEILDLWWAPKPWKTDTKSMDFREGGFWLYAMRGPEGEVHWCRNDYQRVSKEKFFSGLDAFCDENGVINMGFPRTEWENTFSSNGETTTVSIQLTYKSFEDLEKIIQMGFKEGFAMALQNLDLYLEQQFRLRQENKATTLVRTSTYLNFPGNTEEAFTFYKKVFRSEFGGKGIQRFGDIPASTDHPPVSDSVKKMILHVELPITGNHVLMATDAPREMGFTLTPGNNMHINIEPESRDEATRIFTELSEGGTVIMPLQDMFFGAYYGQLTDKYNINWMVNYQEK